MLKETHGIQDEYTGSVKHHAKDKNDMVPRM